MSSKLQEILDRFPTHVVLDYAYTSDEDNESAKRVTAGFSFSEKGFGCGEIAIVATPEGVFIDTEHMSKERVIKYLTALVESAITDVEKDPAKHLKYNEVMGSQCGESCKICYP